MPLFRKQSPDAKKRLQHQLYLMLEEFEESWLFLLQQMDGHMGTAKEAPEKTYDISNCEITDIPSGTYSVCKVLQKEALIAHGNWISSLKGGGNMQDLRNLRVLDLHNNEMMALPDEIGYLRSLQVLNIENNKLKHLPQSIGNLTMLQTLNVRGNKLKDIPGGIKDMKSLRTLDISDNTMTRLPHILCYVRTLENLIVTTGYMEYPSPDICSQGTATIMKFLCSECGLLYEPPSKFLLDVLDGHSMPSSFSSHSIHNEMDTINDKVRQYELSKANRQHDMKYLEDQLEEDNRLQARLAAESAINKKHLLDSVAQDQERLQDELMSLQTQKEHDRKRLIKSLYEAEQNASYIVEHLLELNEKANRSEELLEQLEKERIESEEWFKVRQEESQNLRKKEVLRAMELTLAANEEVDQIIQHYLVNKDEVTRLTHLSNDETNGLVENILHERDLEQQCLVECLLREEKLQKEAFIVLQKQKDSKHKRITTQINLIHQQLAELSVVEREQRKHREEIQKDVLEQRRLALTELLVQLMLEKDCRESQLQKRMLEMEEQRETDQTDYWLVQYQRLMDRKPDSLIDREKQLEFSVVEILEASHAVYYIPVFARHRISIETLCNLLEDDLKQMGMHELGLRKAVLREVDKYKAKEEEKAAAKLKKLEEPFKSDWLGPPPIGEESTLTPPSAPKKSPLTPTSPPLDIIARGIDTECVICMDRQSSMLFLNCGHVCSCHECAKPLQECPMCRSEIHQRIFLV